MKNETINLITEIAEKSVATIKNVGELNQRSPEKVHWTGSSAQLSDALTDVKVINEAEEAVKATKVKNAA